MFESENAETERVYLAVIDAAISALCRSPGVGTKLRPDLVDAVRRKWIAALKVRMNQMCTSSRDSQPLSVTKRLEYTTRPDLVANAEVLADSADDFSDDFEPAEFHHATDTGRRQAQEAVAAEQARGLREEEKRRKLEAIEARKEEELSKLVFEDLGDELAEKYFPEPQNCAVRIFAQTEVCDSTGKRLDSKWLVVLSNGILRFPGRCELLFRSARQTFQHCQT